VRGLDAGAKRQGRKRKIVVDNAFADGGSHRPKCRRSRSQQAFDLVELETTRSRWLPLPHLFVDAAMPAPNPESLQILVAWTPNFINDLPGPQP
jgi:hypothetical protein